jgi:hypothetical protein
MFWIPQAVAWKELPHHPATVILSPHPPTQTQWGSTHTRPGHFQLLWFKHSLSMSPKVSCPGSSVSSMALLRGGGTFKKCNFVGHNEVLENHYGRRLMLSLKNLSSSHKSKLKSEPDRWVSLASWLSLWFLTLTLTQVPTIVLFSMLWCRWLGPHQTLNRWCHPVLSLQFTKL